MKSRRSSDWPCASSLFSLFVLCGLVFQFLPANSFSQSEPETASNIIQSVIQTLPDRPVRLTAELTAKDKRGRALLSRNLEIELDPSPGRIRAVYTLFDAFGAEMERLEIIRQEGAPTQYMLHKEGAATPITDPTQVIEGLDFSWADLSFDYLWWPDVELLGEEEKIERPCYLVKITPPDGLNAYSHVELWVDQGTRGLLQAEGFGPGNELVKRLQIKNLIKINDLWTPGDIEVHSLPSRNKTRLRIRDIHMPDAPPTPPQE